MKKIFLILMGLIIIQNASCAKDILQFDFPNSGWHKVQSPDGVAAKQCYVPINQSSENYTEMLIFYERILKNADISPIAILQKQLGKDKTNFTDIYPQYIKKDLDNAMVTWCSEQKNTCSIQRAFQGKEGVVVAIYMNKMPHYSQNMFSQWSNILGQIKLYEPQGENKPNNLIEL